MVIAIIGLLSAIILASLSTAKNKSNDAVVQSQMVSMRSAADIYYIGAGAKSYGTAGTSCTTVGSVFADTGSNMLNLLKATFASVGGTWPAGIFDQQKMDCQNTSSNWSVATKLQSSGAIFCVDSTGAARTATLGGNPYTAIYGATGSGSYYAHNTSGTPSLCS